MRSQLEHSVDSKDRWRFVKNLLHNETDTSTPLPAAECARLCTSFAQFFTDKIASIKHNIAHKLCNLPPAQFTDSCHVGDTFDSTQPVTVN